MRRGREPVWRVRGVRKEKGGERKLRRGRTRSEIVEKA